MFLFDKPRTRLFLFILLQLSFFITQTNEYLSMKVNLKNFNGDNFIYTKICLGSHPQCFNLQLDFQSFYVWIYNKTETIPTYIKSFNTSNSTTFKINDNEVFNITYPNLVFAGQGVTDNIIIDDTLNLTDFKFSLVNKYNRSGHYEGIMGLGYLSGEHEKEYSFLEQLYLQKIITHKVFGIEFSSYKTTQIFFGEVPTIILKDYTHYGNCNLIQKKINETNQENNDKMDNPNWQCILKGLYLTKSYKRINEKIPVIFSLNTSSLIMPYHLLPMIKREYNDLIEEGGCWLETRQQKTISLYCSITRTIPSLIILFEKWKINLPEEVLKSKSYFHYYKIMSFIEGEEQLIFSLDILKYFTLIFDKENDQVGFYNPKYISYIGKGPIEKPKYELKIDPSLISEINAYDIKTKIQITLILFGLIMVLTVSGVVFSFFFTKNKNGKSEKLLGGIPLNNRINYSEQELDDIDIRDVMKDDHLGLSQ